GTHALGCERAKPAFESNVYLMLDQGFWNLKVVTAVECFEQLVLGFTLGVLSTLVFHTFADALANVIKRRKFAEFLGEVIIQFRQGFLLDGFDIDFVAEGLAAETFVGEIIGIDDVESTFVASICAAKVFSELGHGVFAADFDENVVHVDGLRAWIGGFRCAIERSLRVVAIGDGAAFDGRERGFLFLQRLQGIFDFVVGDGNFGAVSAQFLVALHLDLRHDLEAGLELQRLAFVRVQVGDAGLRNRDQAETLGLLAEVFGDERVHNVVLDFLREALADDGGRNMAAAKTRDARQLLIFLDQGVGFASDFLGRNLNFDFSLG